MSDQQAQDHPGPEWVPTYGGGYYHVALTVVVGTYKGLLVVWTSGDAAESPTVLSASSEAEACRAISAAALAWERMKVEQAPQRHYHSYGGIAQ